MAVIACVDLDPFLVGLVRRIRPDDEVVEVDPSDLEARRWVRYAAVVMSTGSPGLRRLGRARLAERTVLVAGARNAWVPPTHPGPAVRRPVEAAELRQALAAVVPAGRWDGLRSQVGGLLGSSSTDGVFGVARVAGAASASALALTDASPGPPLALVVALVLWSLARMWVRESIAGLVAVDVLLATAAIVAGAGTGSPFLIFAAVVAAEVGYVFPSAFGATLVGVATLAGTIPVAAGMRSGVTTASDLIGWGALVPLSSVVGVLAHRVRTSTEGGNLRTLQELHATLDRLAKQAQGIVGTLDVRSVVEQTMVTVREDLGATASVLLLGDGDVLDVADAYGLQGTPPPRVVTPRRREPGLPDELTRLLPAGDRLAVELDAMGASRGVLILVVPAGEATRDVEAELEELSAEIAVAIDNARLFGSIRELTVDDERRRLARELHDGVIQSLVHVRFELDLVARMIESPHTDEIVRLRDVVGQAVDEVRATVNGLRSVRLSAGLGSALLSVAREYERPDLRIVVDADPVEVLTPEVELQLLRIAQEAISNAVHHGEASLVFVRLWEDGAQAHLEVADDGVGIDRHASTEATRGVGLRAMQERAELLGATLDFSPGTEGGTCVQVGVPLERMLT